MVRRVLSLLRVPAIGGKSSKRQRCFQPTGWAAACPASLQITDLARVRPQRPVDPLSLRRGARRSAPVSQAGPGSGSRRETVAAPNRPATITHTRKKSLKWNAVGCGATSPAARKPL